MNDIYLLRTSIADIGCQKRAGLSIPCQAMGIPQAVSEDLRQCRRVVVAGPRIRHRYGIRIACSAEWLPRNIRINSQDSAQVRIESLEIFGLVEIKGVPVADGQVQQAMVGICNNFPIPLVGGLMRRVVMPLGARLRPPSDQLGHRVAQLIQQPGEARDRLSAGLYFELDRNDPVGLAEMCLRKVIAAEPIEQKLRKSLRRNIAPHDFESAIAEGLAQGIVNDIEARTLREAMELTTLVIQVDEFGEHRVPVEEQQPAATG